MISLCITTYNRYDLTLESFRQVLDDPRISEIVIVDDNSKPETSCLLFNTLSRYDKVRFYVNQENIGMSRNKARAIEYAHNEWCILFDSDNVIDGSYLDAIPFDRLSKGYIYCPSFAKPQFDYRKFEGMVINSETAKSIINKPMGEPLFNTCNYVVNRQEYLRVFQYNEAMKGTDTIWFNYLWLKDGGKFFVLKGLEYFHRVHNGSGFLEDCDYNMKKAAEVKQLIQTLR
jgi:glycosyltransferase involved in cell wall biosynthesis